MYEDGSFKSINEKLFKSEIEANDDNREIAETVQDTELSDELMTLLERLRNEFSDFSEDQRKSFQNAMERQITPVRLEKITPISNLINQVDSSVGKADFNNFDKASIGKLQEFFEEFESQYALYEDGRDQLDGLLEVSDGPLKASISRIVNNKELNKVSMKLKSSLLLLKSKLLNYKQNSLNPNIELSNIDDGDPTQAVVGSGRKQTGFLNLGPYQTKEKLIV
jgi:hypothetical protein|tara:strand:+ start:649 stop:1317 length:669 start_codon:yes stop_codon:yes gene_type:complete